MASRICQALRRACSSAFANQFNRCITPSGAAYQTFHCPGGFYMYSARFLFHKVILFLVFVVIVVVTCRFVVSV